MRNRQVEALLDEVDHWVTASLVAGRLSQSSLPVRRLLGQVVRARLAASRGPQPMFAAGRLTIAEQSLRAALEQCQTTKSHLLEWLIIALIALDIVIAVV